MNNAEINEEVIYRLTANIEDASDAETEEILSRIESMSEDDLWISSSKRITI